MKEVFVPFGEWLPDLPDYKNPGSPVASNVLPDIKGYRPMRQISTSTDALTGACLGMFWAQDDSQTYFNFAGDNTKLYRLSGTTWDNVTRLSGGAYNASQWEFAKWGERILATNLVDDIQYFDMGSSTDFAALAGTPPKAQRIAVIRDHVVLGDIDDSGTKYPSRVQWSGFNNSEAWGSSQATQADFQDLYGRGGRIQKIVPGEYGIIFQEHSVWRMSYTGPPTIFRFDEVEEGRGTPAPQSVCWTGKNIFFLGHDGFTHFDGQVFRPIGAHKVDKTFWNDVNKSSLDKVIGAVDRANRLAMWIYPSGGSTTPNKYIVYSWAANRWSEGHIATEYIGEAVSAGYTLDDLDPILADIDSASIPVDSDAYLGGTLNFHAFNGSHQRGTFDGSTLTATLDTAEYAANGKRLFINNLRPMVEGIADSTLAYVYVRDTQGDNLVNAGGARWSWRGASSTPLAMSMNDIGEYNIRVSARYARARMVFLEAFDYAQGVELRVKQEGRR
jgi:hypothetical protein